MQRSNSTPRRLRPRVLSEDAAPVVTQAGVESRPSGHLRMKQKSLAVFTSKEGLVVTNALTKSDTFEQVYACMDCDSFKIGTLKRLDFLNIGRSTSVKYSEDPVKISEQAIGYQLTIYDALDHHAKNTLTLLLPDLVTCRAWEKAIKAQRNNMVRAAKGTTLGLGVVLPDRDGGSHPSLSSSLPPRSKSDKGKRIFSINPRPRLASGGSEPAAPPSVQFQCIVKTGWVQRQAGKTDNVWKKNLFILCPQRLTWHEVTNLREVPLPGASKQGFVVESLKPNDGPHVSLPGVRVCCRGGTHDIGDPESDGEFKHRLLLKAHGSGKEGSSSSFVISLPSRSELFEWESGFTFHAIEALAGVGADRVRPRLARQNSLGSLAMRSMTHTPESVKLATMSRTASPGQASDAENGPSPLRRSLRRFLSFGSMASSADGASPASPGPRSSVRTLPGTVVQFDVGDSKSPVSVASHGGLEGLLHQQVSPHFVGVGSHTDPGPENERPWSIPDINPWIDVKTLPLYATQAQAADFNLPMYAQPPSYGPDADTNEYYDLKLFRILSLNGGGYRGIMPTIWLTQIEEEIQDFCRHVKMFASTSSGAIIAGGLANGYSGWQMRQFYEGDSGRMIFADKRGRGVVEPAFSDENKKKVFNQGFGALSFGDLSRTLLISAIELSAPLRGHEEHHCIRTKVFHNLKNSPDLNIQLADAILASTAAPTYFPVYSGFVDGGLSTNNTSLIGLSYAVSPQYCNQPLDNIRLLNIGCGFETPNVEFADGDEGKWGVAQWGTKILDIMLTAPTFLTTDLSQVALGDDKFREMDVVTDIPLDATDRMADLVNVAKARSIDEDIEWIRKHFMGA